MKLTLRSFIIPGFSDSTVSVFSDAFSALAHLCDHVLTAPECYDWTFVLETYAERIDPTDPNARFRYAKEIWNKKRDQDAQWLYDEYALAVERAVKTGYRTDFVWKCSSFNERDWKALGLSGVYVIFSRNFVRSAMLPGRGTASTKARIGKAPMTPEERRKNPLPREVSLKTEENPSFYKGSRRFKRKSPREKSRIPPAPVFSLSSEQKLKYCYKIFVRSARFIRRTERVNISRRQSSVMRHIHPAALPDYQGWLALTRKERPSVSERDLEP